MRKIAMQPIYFVYWFVFHTFQVYNPADMKYTLLFTCLFIWSMKGMGQTYSVGVTTVTYTDASRSNRSIPVEVHYPALTNGSNTQIASDSFPFVVFGHGFVMTASCYYPFADSLARRGYIFAFPTTESSISPSHPNFAQDLIYVYNALIAASADPTSLFYHHVTARGAIAGHSMGGGCTVLSASYSNPAVCYWTLAEATTNPSSVTAAPHMTKPYLSLAGSYDCIAPYSTNQLPTYDSSGSPCKVLVEVTGASHCQWGVSNTECNLGQTLSGCANPPLSQSAQINTGLSYIEPYLDYYLKGTCRSWTSFDSVYTVDVTDTKTRSCTNVVPASPSISGPAIICSGIADTLAAQPSGFIYQWSNGATSASISILTGGTYDVTVGNGTCSLKAPPVTETLIPVLSAIGAISGADSLCAGSDSVSYSVPIDAGASSYYWSLPSGWATAGGNNSIYLSVNDSSGTLSVTASNLCGYATSLPKSITVLPGPQLTGTITGPDSICPGSGAQEYAFLGASPDSLLWSVVGPFSIISGQYSDTVSLSGLDSTGILSLSAYNVCGNSASITLPIAVADTPHPTVVQNGDTLLSSISGAGYQWYMNGQAINGADMPYLIPDSAGRYDVVATNQKGCTGSSAPYSYTRSTTSVSGLSEGRVSIYPNPATDVIYIRSDREISHASIRNSIGQKVITKTGSMDNLDISPLSPDIYLVEVTTKDGEASFFRIVKQ
jgi:hypothetical protein